MHKRSPFLTRKVTKIVDNAYYLWKIDRDFIDPLDRYA